jgi:Entner-Doudoroff aldolase
VVRASKEVEMAPEEFVRHLGEVRASAIVRAGERDVAARAMDAAIRGGFRVVEFTLTTPGALDLIASFSRRPGIIVGAGTVLGVDEARAAVGAGARFLVSPVVDEAVIAEARALGVAAMPGAYSPTEMLRAHRAGAPLQKLFPAPAGGPAAVRQLLGPMPFLRIVPTAGVDADNAAAYLEAGAHAVGFVSSLFDPEDLRQGRTDGIEDRARLLLASLRGAAPSKARAES